MLELVKPITLSMRLFGNIYAGEVALGVITALTIASSRSDCWGSGDAQPDQALIFSVLTLVFIVLAIESHEHEEGHVAEEALDAVHGGQGKAGAAAGQLTRPRALPTKVSMIPCRWRGE